MWCDFGANLVQHFMLAYSRYSRYQTVLSKLKEIISTFGRIQKMLRFFGAFFIISFDELRCNEAHLVVYEKWSRLRLWSVPLAHGEFLCASLHGRRRRLLHGNEVDASYSPLANASLYILSAFSFFLFLSMLYLVQMWYNTTHAKKVFTNRTFCDII